MILICDCGSTKAEWVVMDGNTVAKRFVTNGFNPNFTDNATMNSIVGEAKNCIDYQSIRMIYFYGSGCGSDGNQLRMKLIFSKFYPQADAEVYPDTLAACHALFGNNPGVACILGTGSNACRYDGVNITESVASLGFMIGDEGSGCHIGKRIVHDYFLGLMPEDMRAKFDAQYHLDRESFLKRVYQGEQPSRYLAEFARFAAENVDNQYIIRLIEERFEKFIKCYLKPHADLAENAEKANEGNGSLKRADLAEVGDSVGFVGSVAFTFKDILTKCLENHDIKCSKILKNPMDGLVEYYSNLIA